MYKNNPLQMTPVLPSSRRLVNVFNRGIANLSYEANVTDRPTIDRTAQAVVDTLMRDGKVSFTEAHVLKGIKERLNFGFYDSPDEQHAHRGGVVLYNEIEVDPATRTARVVQHDLNDPVAK